MQLFVRGVGGARCLLADGTVGNLKRDLAERAGVPPEELYLTAGGRRLCESFTLEACGLSVGMLLRLEGRLRGGGAAPLTLTLKPRLQKDKWSLYWKESMETKTELLEDVVLQFDPAATVAEVLTAVQRKLGWADPDASERLVGFKDPWQFAVHQGRTLDASKSLAALGIQDRAALVCVRRALIPEEWKVLEEGQEEDDLSSDEER